MPSVLLIAFAIQLALHLLNTLFPKTVNELAWWLYAKLPTPQSKDAQEVATLRASVVKLNREMGNTSAQDDFAKWARLRREHDKAKAKYDEKAKAIQDFRGTFDKVVSALRWLGTQGLQFLCNAYYGKQPMFYLPRDWVPYPVEWILSFPRAPIGSISINVWAIACASIIAMVSEAVRASLTLKEGQVVEGNNKGQPLKMEAKSGGREKKEL